MGGWGGGGAESHLEGCSRYSRHSMPFMEGTIPRLPSRTQPSSRNLRRIPTQIQNLCCFLLYNVIKHKTVSGCQSVRK